MKLIVLLFPLILSGCSSPGNSDVKGTPASTPDVAERKIVTQKEDKFCYVHYYLDAKPDWKIRNSEDARGVLIGGFKELGAKGISAYWGWRIRDAIVAPVDIQGIGIKGDVIWIGEYTSLLGPPHPFAFVFLNARTGAMKVIGELPDKSPKSPDKSPKSEDIKEFVAYPVPSDSPNDYFRDFKVTQEDLATILKDYFQIHEDHWKHGYSHVAFGDRMGHVILKDGNSVTWMVKPGGLAWLEFSSGKRVYLVKEKTKWPLNKQVAPFEPANGTVLSHEHEL